jgi:DNA-binding GntR family transcriptional regulator
MASFKTKTSMVYDYIKERILNGKYAPGERINPKDLSLQLNISPVPVREAVNKLSTEGLIKMTPHLGATIANINKAEYKEIHMIRTELECFAIGLSLDHLTEERLSKLERIIEDSAQAIQSGKYEKFRRLSKQFHQGIYRDSPYQILVKIIMDLYDKVQLVSTLPWTKERAEHNLREHRLILNAVREKNAASVCKILKNHRVVDLHRLQEVERRSAGIADKRLKN